MCSVVEYRHFPSRIDEMTNKITRDGKIRLEKVFAVAAVSNEDAKHGVCSYELLNFLPKTSIP